MKYLTLKEFMGKLQITDVSLLADMENAGFLKPAAVSVTGSKYYSRAQVRNFEYLYSLYLDFCRKNKKELSPSKDIKIVIPTVTTNNQVLDKLESSNKNEDVFTEQIVAPTCLERGYTKHICENDESKSYCDNYTEKLGHDYKKNIIRKNCNEKGIAEFVCKRCGHTYSEELPVQEHDFILSKTFAPDCTNPGTKIFVCKNCDETKEEVLMPLGHDFEEHVVKKENCTKEGLVKLVCKRCGAFVTEKKPPIGHSYAEFKRQEAECEKEGSIIYKCSICGNTYSENIPAKEHEYSVSVIEPTCMSPGKTVHTCKLCNKSYDTDEVPALGHNYKEEIVTYPSESASGLKRYTCVNCNDTYEEYMPPVFIPTTESVLDKLNSLEEENNKLIAEENSKAEELKKKLNEEPVGPKIVQGKKRKFA